MHSHGVYYTALSLLPYKEFVTCLSLADALELALASSENDRS